jgi:broad specificity phosphatase PhoE
MKLILVRHGETDLTREARLQGSTDLPLNQVGMTQARVLTEALRQGSIDFLVSSPLLRAAETAQIIAFAAPAHPALRIEPLIKEVGLGAWEGLTLDEVRRKYPRGARALGGGSHFRRPWRGALRTGSQKNPFRCF